MLISSPTWRFGGFHAALGWRVGEVPERWGRSQEHGPVTAPPPLACHTIHWSPVFGGRPDLPMIVRAVAAAGFTHLGLDLTTVETYVAAGGSLATLTSLLDGSGLAVTDVVALTVRRGEDPGELAARLAPLVEATSAPVCVCAVAEPIGGRAVVEGLCRGLDVLAPTGARLAVEFGAYMGLRTLREAVVVCTDIGWERAGVLIDTYQCARAGTTVADLGTLEPGHIALVQVADAAGATPAGDALVEESRHHRLVPGGGELPLGKMLDAVVATGYRGPVVAEVLSDRLRRAEVTEAVADLHRSLTALTASIGRP